jgi:hypothetical protein
LELAKQFNIRKEWAKAEAGAYSAASKNNWDNGWLDKSSIHMDADKIKKEKK